MKEKIIFFAKNILVCIITLSVFGLASQIIGGSGNIPQFIMDAYKSSIFVRTGTKTLAIVILCSIIIFFLLVNFNFIKDGVHNNRFIKGLLYGGSFGIAWFFGFTEFIVINHSDKIVNHIRSGIRDLVCLSIFGLIAGALLCKNSGSKIERKMNSLMAIPIVAVLFAIFHGAQYYFTFQSVSSYQLIKDVTDILWLLAFGAWIGFMYYLFKPGIKVNNKYFSALFFSYFIFGTNWLLYNLFYNIFLDIPLIDIFSRSIIGCTGVFIGASVYEYLASRKSFDNITKIK